MKCYIKVYDKKKREKRRIKLPHYILGYLKDSNAAAHSVDTGIS